MPASMMWILAEGATLTEEAGALVLRGPGRELPLRSISKGMRAVLADLATGPRSEEQLAAIVREHDGPEKTAVLYFSLNRILQVSLLSRTVVAEDGTRLLTMTALNRSCKFPSVFLTEEARYGLSRFAYLHREGEEIILESPLSLARVALHTWHGAALAAALAKPANLATLRERLPGIGDDVLEALLEAMVSAGMLSAVNGEGAVPMDDTLPLRQWEFHDLLFHARSRMGRTNRPTGGTFRFKETIEPLPAIKPPMSDNVFELQPVDIEALKESDVPFTAVLENRKSRRAPGAKTLTAKQLSEFLYRVARVRSQQSTDSGEYAFRPYPGAGGEYELELYLAVFECDGQPSGLYHYDPAGHKLEFLKDLDERIYTLLGAAAGAAVRETLPDVLFMYAARFQRVSWKYESIAYAAILKDVGVLVQTMYLVATAMNLSPCAIGAGDSDLFASVVGTDYYAETTVGEFILGGTAAPEGAEKSGEELANLSGAHWG